MNKEATPTTPRTQAEFLNPRNLLGPLLDYRQLSTSSLELQLGSVVSLSVCMAPSFKSVSTPGTTMAPGQFRKELGSSIPVAARLHQIVQFLLAASGSTLDAQ